MAIITRDNVLVQGYVGPNDSGKTWLAMHHINLLPAQIRIRLNWKDPTLSKGVEVISEARELNDRLKLWYGKGRPKGLIICWDGAKKYGNKLGFELVSKLALQYGQIELLADEAHKYCSRNFEKEQPFLDDILSRGFHEQVSFKWTSTRPTQLSPEFRSQSKRIHLFFAPDNTFASYARDIGAGSLWSELQKAEKYSHILNFRRDMPKLMPPYKPK